MSLLEKVQDRVLSNNPSSAAHHLPVICAGIDKLNARFANPIETVSLMRNAREIGLNIKQEYLRDRTPYLKVGTDDRFLHFKLSLDRSHITKMISNPNRFETWQEYYECILALLTSEHIQKINLSRLDLNLDFAVPFLELIQSIDLKNKKCAVSFNDESGDRTGLLIGKGCETIEIYDKAKKNKLASDYTRLELRLSGSKVPSQNLDELPRIIQESNFFETIQGFNVTFLTNEHSESQLSRLNEFKNILMREGLHLARKTMDRDRNFERNFKGLIEIKPWGLQPNLLFKNTIRRFFNEKKGNLNHPAR